MSKCLELYDRLSPETAAKLVERWQVDPEYLKSILRLQSKRH
jgi:hypothetical protein